MGLRSACTFVLAASAVVWMAVFSLRQLEVTADLTRFLSDTDEIELAEVSRGIASSRLARTLILVLRAPELETALEAAREWEMTLAGSREVEAARSGPHRDSGRAAFELYFPRRFLFLSDRPEAELPERFTAAGLAQAVRDLRAELSLPQAAVVKELAGRDPLLAFLSQMRRIEEAQPIKLEVVDGQYALAARNAAVLLVTTRHSAFDSAAQRPFLDLVERSFADLNREWGGGLSLEQAGVHRFSVASERRAREDVSFFTAISVFAIGILFLGIFRSLRLLVISLLPLLAGIVTATAVGIAIFGSLHVITLVFGSTLIGVCIDYPIHLVNHHTMVAVDGGPWATLRRVRSALVVGAATTVVGFVGFAWSDFPAIRELGIFGGVGVLAALLATGAMVAPLLPARGGPTAIQRRLASAFETLFRVMEQRPGWTAALPLCGLLVCFVGIPFVTWEDDVAALNATLDQDLIGEEERIRTELSQLDAGRFVVVIGRDEESALERNDAVYVRLTKAVQAGLIGDFRSFHSVLWSTELQQRNWITLTAFPDLEARLRTQLQDQGFRPSHFTPFGEALRGDQPTPLRMSELRASPLAEVVDTFHIELESGSSAILSYLRAVADPVGLKTLLTDLDGVWYLDQRAFIGEVFARYRERATVLILIGLGAVIALLYLRYRDIRLAAAAVAPALLGAASALAILSLLGTPINLLHMLGLLLVLGFGVDYSVFLLESRDDRKATTAAMVGVSLACLSTCLSFGLLAASSFPALRSLGESTGLGVFLSLVFAPTALVLSRVRGSSA